MSYLFDSGPQGLDGSYHFGGPGLGVLGSVIRATTGTGEHGAGYLYNDWDDAGDDGKEFQGLVLTPPSAGTFFAFEDGSFSLVDAADGSYTFVYRLYVDGVDEGTATATIVIGAGLATITGESSITLGAVTSAATGVVTPLPITGESSITLGAVTSTAEGVVIAAGILGQSSVTLGDVVSVAEGVVLPGGGHTDIQLAIKILRNRKKLDAATGQYIVYDDDGVTVLYSAAAWEDAAGTIPYRGGDVRRIDRLE